MRLFDDVVVQYEDFAASAGDSPSLRAWARGVAADPEVVAWIGSLPPIKRQPNLVFAAARWHGVDPHGPYGALHDALLGDAGEIRSTVLGRSTQTNEVGRVATLVPAIATVAGPVALIEVGASAGLCLYPDRFDYDWGVVGRLQGSGGPELGCAVTGPMPVPDHHPGLAWRSGIDLNPLDVTHDDAVAWLTNLVWPEQDDRRRRLRAAIDVARADPPRLSTGDLFELLPAEIERASAHGTVVVFHSAVIAYLEPSDREAFHQMMTDLVHRGACHWISNEAPRVLTSVTATGPQVPAEMPTFVLGVDGAAVAWTHQHGASMRWFG